MARKVNKAKKPTETMRQRQSRLLREQRARKADASVKTNPASSTPRGAQGPRTAPQQGPSQRTSGLQGTRSRGSVSRSAPKPQFSTKSAPKPKGGALARQGSSAITPSRKGAAASTRVQKVQVKVDSPRQLPPGKKGGAVSTGKGPRRTNINSNPSKGTQMGTRGGGVKGQPRLPAGTIRSAGTVGKALSKTGSVAGRIALPLAAYSTAKDLKDSLDRGEGYARLPGMISRALKGNGKKNRTSGSKTNGRGRRTGPAPASNTSSSSTKPKKRGMSNIPPSEGRLNNPNYGKPGNPKSANKPKPVPTPERKPKPTPQRTPSPTSTRPAPTRKPTPRAATGANARSLRSGPTPPKPRAATGSNAQSLRSGPTPPKKKAYGSTGRKGLKQSSRMAAALKDLKIRKYKK